VVATGLLVLVVAALALLQLSPVSTWLVGRLTGFLPLNPRYGVEVGRVSGDWLHALHLENVRLVRDTTAVATVERVSVRYDLRRLRGDAQLEELVLAGARATTRLENGRWDLADVLRPADTTARGTFRVARVAVHDGQLTAHLSLDSAVQIRSLTFEGRNLVLGAEPVVTIEALSAAVAPPGTNRYFAVSTRGALTPEVLRLDPVRIQTERTDIAGRAVLPRRLADPALMRRLDVRLDARPLALADLAAIVPAVRPGGELTLEGRARGEGRLITATLAARLDEATVRAEARVPLERGRPAGYHVTAKVGALDPSALLRNGPLGNLTGLIRADLRGSTLRESNGRLSLELGGAEMGGTAVERLKVDATLSDGRADLTASGLLPAAEFEARGWARPFDSMPAYRLAGKARRIPGGDTFARTLRGDSLSTLEVRFTVRGAGVSAARARVAGSVDLIAVSPAETPASLGRADLSINAGRARLRPDLLVAGGHVRAVATARLGDSLQLDVRRGVIDDVDLGRLLRDTVPRPISGTFAGEYQGGRARGSLEARLAGGHVVLEASARPTDSIATFSISQATFDRVDLTQLLGTRGPARPVTLTARGDGAWDADQRLRYDLAVDVADGRVSLAGTATPRGASPGIAIREGRLDSLNLGRLLGGQTLSTSLNARFRAAVNGRRVDSLRAKAALVLFPSRVNAAELDSGLTTLTVEGRAVRGEMRVAGPGGSVDVRTRGVIDSLGLNFDVTGGARLEQLARWTGNERTDGRIESRFALRAATDSGGLRSLDGTITAVGAVGDVRINPLHISMIPDTGAVRVDTLILRSNVATLDGGGRVPLRGSSMPDTLRATGRIVDPAPLASMTGTDTVALDSGRVVLGLTGGASGPVATATADLYRVFMAGNLAEQVTLAGSASLSGLRPTGIRGELTMTGGAYQRLAIPEAHVIASFDSVVSLDATARLEDTVTFATSLRGRVHGDTVRAVLRRLDLAQWSLARPANLELRGPRFGVARLEMREGRRRIELRGVLDRSGRSDMAIELDSVDLDVLNELELSPVPGLVDGSLRLTGTAEAPSLAGKLGLVVRERGDTQQVGRMGTELAWTTDGLRIDAVAAANEGGFLTVNGTLPIRFRLTPADTVDIDRGTTPTVNLRALSDSFGLAFFTPLLPPEAVRNLKGRLELDMRFGGTLDAPTADGGFALDSAGLTLPTINVTYEHGSARGRLDGDRLTLADARLFTGKNETLEARGTVLLRPLDDPSLDVAARLRDFRISDSKQLRSAASGEAKLSGTVVKPVLAGRMRLGRTDLFVGTKAAAIQVEDVALTSEDIRQLTRYFGPAVTDATREHPGLVERFTLDLDVAMPERVWVRRRRTPKMDIEVAGRINLRQQPRQEMEFYGQVTPVPGRSSIDISGREFRITEGDVSLEGPVDSARLDVSAEYQVPAAGNADDNGVIVTVHAVGHPDSLGLDFSSDPSMSQEDILSYVVTGRPASDNPLAGSDAGGGSIGEQVAYGTLAEAISTRAGEGLGFDVFQIRQEGTQGLTLTAGRYLASRLFLNFQLPLQVGGDARTAPGANLGPGFELEYTASRWLRGAISGGSINPGFTLRGRYAY
jgi:translocation and assembly module TamB